MNLSGLIYHCFLPTNSKWRYLLRYFDQISTGMAGMFMANALQSIHHEINMKNIVLHLDDSKINDDYNNNDVYNYEKYKISTIIGLSIILPIIHPIFGDIIYIGGVLTSVGNVISCYKKLRQYDVDDGDDNDKELIYLKRMSSAVMTASIIAGIGVLSDKYVAKFTNGTINVMRNMFFFGDIGYMFTVYYGLKHYAIN